MLKQKTESTGIRKRARQATHDRTTCQHDYSSPIAIDSLTALLAGEREFYYYLIKDDKFLKTILKILWISEQEKGNNIKVKVIGKDGDKTYIDLDRKIIQKAEKRQTFEKFWKTFQSEFDQIEFSNTDTSTEVARIQKIIDHDSIQHVKKRYKELLLKYHPDKNKSKNAKRKTEEIISAYEFIKNDMGFMPPSFLLNLLWNDESESILSTSVEEED